jgi:hypothetical protein
MATWTTIPDSSLEPGKPIRAIDGLALRDNAIAIAEGQPGAPKIVDAALSTTATNTGRDWVLARTALADAGAVGTYAWLVTTTAQTISAGSTYAGSALRYHALRWLSADISSSNTYGTAGANPSGTWRAMGTQSTSSAGGVGCVFMRIS